MPSSGPQLAPTMIQLPCITPVAHDHRPVSRSPSRAGTPRPVGARGAGARNGRVAKAPSWARSSNSASIQLCSAKNPIVQALDAHPCAIRRTGSRMAGNSACLPP